jgi:fatty acid desaturase
MTVGAGDLTATTAPRAETLGLLRQSLRAQGLLGKDPKRCLAELAFHVATAVAGVLLVAAGGSPLLEASGLVLAALGSLGVATNGHTASHHGTSNNWRLDEVLTYFCFPFFLQVSASNWRHRHVVVHHPVPNVIGQDDDVDLMPFFAYTQQEAARGGALARLYRRHQWLLFPVGLLLNGFNTQRTAWAYLLGRLRDRRARSAEHWADLGALGLHWLVWWIAPLAYFAAADVALFNLGRVILMGYGMFALFAPAHWPAAAHAVASAGGREDHLLIQTANTVNYRAGAYGRLLCSGVQYQIEHHLFPDVSHTRYPKIAAQVEAFCERHGYPYRTLGWGEAIRESIATLRAPKVVARDPSALRERLRLGLEGR